MKKVIFLLIGGISLCGCVSKIDRSRQQDEINKTIPMCGSTKQCEAGWSGARQWVTQHCGMKIQTYSNDYIETYSSIGDSTNTACQVTKNPLPNGLSSINIAVSCANIFGCVPDQFDLVINFNREINEKIKNFSPIKIGVILWMSDKEGNIVNSASESFGLLIKSVIYDSPAKINGLKENDIITHLDKKRMTKISDFDDVMESHVIGDVIKISVYRDGKSIDIPITI